MLLNLRQELFWLKEKKKFVKNVIDGSLVVTNRKKIDMCQDLKRLGISTKENAATISTDGDDHAAEQQQDTKHSGYEYLLSMPIYTLSSEKIAELREKIAKICQEVAEIEEKSIEEMYRSELDTLEQAIAM